MDENLSRAVREVFVRLHEQGLIYRGKYIINWCPWHETAISDLEVKHEEVSGKLWEIRYPVIGTSEFITVATTRPETIFGNSSTGIADGPGQANIDIALSKSLTVHESSRVQFRAEFFNALNHPQFANPVASSTPSAGP